MYFYSNHMKDVSMFSISNLLNYIRQLNTLKPNLITRSQKKKLGTCTTTIIHVLANRKSGSKCSPERKKPYPTTTKGERKPNRPPWVIGRVLWKQVKGQMSIVSWKTKKHCPEQGTKMLHNTDTSTQHYIIIRTWRQGYHN